MAGITNAAYRRLCAEQGAGLYVCEMITSRGIVERDAVTLGMLVFDELETVRSVQLYGTDPVYVGKAAEILCADYGVEHIDLNFGCPVPKVTRKGGGGALPWKRGLLGRILESAVAARGAVRRAGHDEDPQGHRRGPPDLPRRAAGSPRRPGCAAIALHGRTVDAVLLRARRLGRHRRRSRSTSDIPVLGNGDIWEAADALRMMEETGATGVVVGRGCLGRPWLFRDLAAAFAGETVATLPTLGEVAEMMRRHAELLVQHLGEERGCKEFRKHVIRRIGFISITNWRSLIRDEERYS